MPYSGPDDKSLPNSVKKLNKTLRDAWVKAWNASYNYCQKNEKKIEADDCESYAFATANSTIKKMSENEMSFEDALIETLDGGDDADEFRKFDPNVGGGVDRDKIPAKDFVDPKGRRFPIVTPGDVSDAVSSYGRAKPKIPFDQFKSRLISICKRKGAKFVAALPEEWKKDMKLEADFEWPDDQSLDEISRDIYNAWHSKYPYAEGSNPPHIREIYDDHLIVVQASSKGSQYFKVNYTMEKDEIEFDERDKWKTVKEVRQWVTAKEKELDKEQFEIINITVELEDDVLTDGKPFDALIPWEGEDGNGAQVQFTEKELKEYVKNTKDAIEATKDTNGEIVGLPIDARGHDKGDGAGWIVGVKLEGKVLRLIPKWTEIGKELIAKKIRKYFSATVSRVTKVILGGTLTNWPAIRDKKGRVLLRPVELHLDKSKGVSNMETEIDFNELTSEQKKQLENAAMAEARKKVLAELANPDADSEEVLKKLRQDLDLSAFADIAGLEGVRGKLFEQMKAVLETEMNRMQQQAGIMVANMMTELKREQEITELTQKLIGGTEENPTGLPIKSDELETFLRGLNEKQRPQAMAILQAIHQNGLVEFSEVGHGKNFKEGTMELDAPFDRYLKEWLSIEGNTVESFFEQNEDVLGSMTKYNLAVYREKVKEE